MAWRTFLRIGSLLIVALAVFDLATLPPVAAQQNGIVGTWALRAPDGNGGANFSWYTFTADGQYQMVSAIQGGRNNGSVVQRWGTYQARPVGGNAYQVAVRITGGAPTQVCAQGQGCTPVQGIQRMMNLNFQVSGNSLRQSDGTVFQRGTVPPQLQARMPATRGIAPVPQSPGIHNGTTGGGGTVIPGVTPGSCDNAQQNRICTVNGGRMYVDNRGCQVCASPY